MALLSIAQITSQVRNAIANNAAVSSLFPSQTKVIIADKKDEKKVLLQEKPEIVVYPRRIKAIEKIIVTLADTTTQQLTGGISALDMPVTPHYVAPRAPIVLCHGLYGFDKIGPDALPLLQVQYWGGIENALAKLGAKVIVTKVPSTGSILERAQTLHAILKSILDGKEVNFIAHSMVRKST